MNAPNHIKSLIFKSSARDGASLELMRVSASHRKGEVQLVLFGDGFEASRYLSTEDLEEIRFWLDAPPASRSEDALRTIREGERL